METGIYLSSLSGKQIDDAIDALQNMCPQIIVTNAGSNQTINCKCTAVSYNENKTSDSTGKCVFNIPSYGTYTITKTGQTPVTQIMDTFKRVTVSLT